MTTTTRARRVKVSGDLWHGRVPPGAVYVGRGAPGLIGSPFRNPFPVKGRGPEKALELFRAHLAANPDLVARARAELAGRDLACWCPIPAAGEPDLCHAAVWLEILTRPAT